jgi:hypothetical protein
MDPTVPPNVSVCWHPPIVWDLPEEKVHYPENAQIEAELVQTTPPRARLVQYPVQLRYPLVDKRGKRRADIKVYNAR